MLDKLNKLNEEYKKGTSVCIDHILGKIYKDALPYEDPNKNCDLADAASEIHDYIDARTGGRDSEYYVREGIKKTGSSTLKGIIEAAESIMKEFYTEKSKDLVSINLKDLNFNKELDEGNLDKISKKLEIDEISDIVHDNVQKAIKDEKEKVTREDEYNKKIEDELTANPDIDTPEKLEAAVDKIRTSSIPTIYQPSLFEAILTKKSRSFNESSLMDSPVHEAIHEYTKLNISKALKLESFSLRDIRDLANKYIND